MSGMQRACAHRPITGDACRGRASLLLLAGVFVLVVAYAGFLWLQFNSDRRDSSEHVENSTAHEEQVTTDRPPVLPGPGGLEQQALSREITEQTPANEKPPQPVKVPQMLTEKPSDVHEQVDAGYAPANEKPPPPVGAPQPLTEEASDAYEQVDAGDAVLEEPVEEVVEDPVEKPEVGPEGDLAISGRVLDRAGAPVAGIKLVAKASYLFDRDKGEMVSVYRYQREAASGFGGAYAFERLADGEYQISTVATEQYPRAEISARAGVDFADLILTGQRDLRVFGIVTTSDGEPLAGVVVTPVMQNLPQISSSTEGSFTFELKLQETDRNLAVRASKKGYQEMEVHLDITQANAGNEIELNIVMESDADSVLAEVTGRVKGPDNDPVAGQRIQLYSTKLRQNYHATTGDDGGFVIRRVEPGDDYMLSINAVDAYKDYFQKNIKITKSGLTLNIELEALDTGTLSGQMVNVFGVPIPNFMLFLQTQEISFYYQRVSGDASGNFMVEKVPAGELRLKTKSNPYYTVEGIRLATGRDLHVPVVLDWGSGAIEGRVFNDQGSPVAVSNITLSWSHEQGGIQSTSRRTTAADEQGDFRFTQLGPGSHRLSINAVDYKPVTLNHDVATQGSLLEVTLEAE